MAERSFEFRTLTSVTSAATPEMVFDVIVDLRAHLEWSGERAADATFKLLTIEASEGPASLGTTFTSTGSNFNGTFHDRSVVTAGDETQPVHPRDRRSLGPAARQDVGGSFRASVRHRAVP